MKTKIIYIIILSVLTFVSCKKDENTVTEYPEYFNLSQEWQTSEPVSQGYNTNKLNNAIENAGRIENLKSLLVVRNGYLISENYFGQSSENEINNIRSVTKNVISILIGIAIDKGDISSVGEPIAPYFEKLGYTVVDEKANITIKHLLTMTSGFEWDEGNESDWGDDHIAYLLNKPLVAVPGEQFNYNTLSTHLLSVILTEATGMGTAEFAQEHLFKPLGITNYEWPTNDGYNIGGSQLRLRARDMAKMGMLFVNKGESNGQQIVPFDWVQQSTTVQVLSGMGWTWESISEGNYGYLWWLDTGRLHGVFMARGYGGQYIYCFPQLKLVIVTTAELATPENIEAQEAAISNLVMYEVFQALFD